MIQINKEKLKEANIKSLKGIGNIIPILFGVLLLISIVIILVPKSWYLTLFTGNLFRDSLIGTAMGSILAGNPITSYILGSGFLKAGVSLFAVTAFIASWTTVGFIQFPAESLILGKRFAFYRNITAFFMSIAVAVITVLIINML